MNWNDEMMKQEAQAFLEIADKLPKDKEIKVALGLDKKTTRPDVPMHLIRKVGGKNYMVNTGDILLTQRGKTFFVTGWDEVSGVVEGVTTDEVKLFVSGPASMFGCHFAEV